mgnify:CR=1 FL=1
MKKIIRYFSLLIGLTASFTSLAREKISLMLDWYVNPDHAAIIVAQQKGFFEKNNLEVEIIEPADPSLPPKLVAAGKVDLAINYQPQLYQQVAEGLPLVRVGSLISSPLNSVVVLKNSNIKTLADLKGKKVLDLGCGYGEWCKIYSEMGASYVKGIDISSKMLDVAKSECSQFSNIEFGLLDMGKLDELNETFDVVVSSLAVHYVEDFEKLCKDVKKILNKGVEIVDVFLEVGLGTFRPVQTENVLEHKMHEESFEISEKAAKIINEAKTEGRRIISVGTTATRALESSVDKNGKLIAQKKDTGIFIYPGYKFKIVDALITNFHLPKSTLLMLVSAFYDREKMLEIYNLAVKEKYHFFSFGDSMFIY